MTINSQRSRSFFLSFLSALEVKQIHNSDKNQMKKENKTKHYNKLQKVKNTA